MILPDAPVPAWRPTAGLSGMAIAFRESFMGARASAALFLREQESCGGNREFFQPVDVYAFQEICFFKICVVLRGE
jgi:hypothetical protein